MEKNRDKIIDVLKGIGIITVVIGHAGFGTLLTNYFGSINNFVDL